MGKVKKLRGPKGEVQFNAAIPKELDQLVADFVAGDQVLDKKHHAAAALFHYVYTAKPEDREMMFTRYNRWLREKRASTPVDQASRINLSEALPARGGRAK